MLIQASGDVRGLVPDTSEVVKYYKLLDKLRPETAKLLGKDNILSLIKEY